jgi:hypothetical protein
MKVWKLSFLLLLLSGCAYNPRVTVYGVNGKQYIAPDLCLAVIQCNQAGEAECRYNATVLTTSTGQTEVEQCKVAK